MEFGIIHCAGCGKNLGYFPVDNIPKKDTEIYCEDCKEKLSIQTSRCPQHPQYKAKQPPRCECRTCWSIYNKKKRLRDAKNKS